MPGPAVPRPAVVHDVRRALEAADPSVRRAALHRAGGLRVADPAERAGLEDAVAEALSDGDADVRIAAIRALVRLGARDALRTLIRAASEDPAPRVRREAVAALAPLVRTPRPAGR